MSDLSTLAPWDAAPFFQPPVTGLSPVGTGASQIVPADPMRVVLIISVVGAAAGGQVISVSNGVTANGPGITLTQSNPFIILTQAEHGPLVQHEWFVWSGGTIQVSFTSISLSRWPEVSNGPRMPLQDDAHAT